MLQLGTVGTNWITEQFIYAAKDSGLYQLAAIYSRSKEKGATFAEPFQAAYYTDYQQFLAHPQLDVVYIASPNSVHYEQAKAALLAGKHIIVEKPAFSTIQELQE